MSIYTELARRAAVLVLLVLVLGPADTFATAPESPATTEGELEDRPAPVARRKCISGAKVGTLCEKDSDCPGSTCIDRNVFTISVGILYPDSDSDLAIIQNLVREASKTLFDATDGQIEIGQAFIYKNFYGFDADLRIHPRGSDLWWETDVGAWKAGGHVAVSFDKIDPYSGPVLAHELVHLIMDTRDEYQAREPECGHPTNDYVTCPHVETLAVEGPERCLMDRTYEAEFCWGRAPDDGNHDLTGETEQSSCRDNRSCWDQADHSWPKTILKPNGAPDPQAYGAEVNETQFVITSKTVRVVLVLDESGSMSRESPSRMELLKVAARNFVALAEPGTEIGIVSYSNDAETGSGRVNVALAAVEDSLLVLSDSIDGLTPDKRTNIGAGLRKAKEMIDDGPITSNTYIALMTDGLNNEPQPQATADADLQNTVDDLLMAGIPIYVTCTGNDLGLESQCSEIATGTEGYYSGSEDAAALPEAFVDIHERMSGREVIGTERGLLSEAQEDPITVYVDSGAESVTFVLMWEDPTADADMTIIDPADDTHESRRLLQGRYARIRAPESGEWQILIRQGDATDSPFFARAYTRNQKQSLTAATRHPSVLPGDPIYIYAYPRTSAGALTHSAKIIEATVTLPDGRTEVLQLADKGRDERGLGDDAPGDGIFTGVYRNTQRKGAYTFVLQADIDAWPLANRHRREDPDRRSPRFVREVRVTAASANPEDIERQPEDGPPDPPG